MDATDVAPREISPNQSPDDLTADAYRRIVGTIGFALPILVYVIAGWRPTLENPWTPLHSISAYYYTGAVSVFAGSLAALAVYLAGYRGYKNDFQRRDLIAARIASVAAVFVALFPTGAPDKFPKLTWSTPISETIHLIAAMVLFLCFSFLTLFQFTRTSVKKGEKLPPGKERRNFLYRLFGIGMLLCILWAGYALYMQKPIFAPEALALEFFAASWLLKGRADKAIVEASKSSKDFFQHSGKMVKGA